MKHLLSIQFIPACFCCAMCLLSCSNPTPKSTSAEGAKKQTHFDYLLGNWMRLQETDDKQTFENWHKVNDHLYHGHGFTLQQQDTIWAEHIELIKIAEDWYFNVTGHQDSTTTPFKLSAITDSSFVCENLQNPFPNKIEYKSKKARLIAEISGQGHAIRFEFKSFK